MRVVLQRVTSASVTVEGTMGVRSTMDCSFLLELLMGDSAENAQGWQTKPPT